MSEIQTSMDFRYPIIVWFPYSSDFRHPKSEHVWFSDRLPLDQCQTFISNQTFSSSSLDRFRYKKKIFIKQPMLAELVGFQTKIAQPYVWNWEKKIVPNMKSPIFRRSILAFHCIRYSLCYSGTILEVWREKRG